MQSTQMSNGILFLYHRKIIPMVIFDTWHSLDAAYKTNHALNRPARQSSTANKPAGNAVDGKLWKASETRAELFPYWLVDLQEDIWVTSVALTNRDSSCKLLMTSLYWSKLVITVKITHRRVMLLKNALSRHSFWFSHNNYYDRVISSGHLWRFLFRMTAIIIFLQDWWWRLIRRQVGRRYKGRFENHFFLWLLAEVLGKGFLYI